MMLLLKLLSVITIGHVCDGYTSTWWYGTTAPYYHNTSPYYDHTSANNWASGASVHYGAQGSRMQLIATPQDVLLGLTNTLTLTCTPGYNDDLSRIWLIQINHRYNDSKVAVADVGYGQSARVVDGHHRTSVNGHIPSEYYTMSGAYLTVTIYQPTEWDCGQWECTLSGLTHSSLMTTQIATTDVHVSNMEVLATEVGNLRRELQAAETTVNDLKNIVDELLQTRGQGFTAFLINNYTAVSGRLPFQRELLDTLGGFSNSVLHPPVDGLYLLTLTVSVSSGHHVTVALRHADQTLVTLVASAAGRGSEGQSSTSAVVSLVVSNRVEVEVVDYSPGAMVLTSPSTLLSGYLIQATSQLAP